jgi:hypothetical protein
MHFELLCAATLAARARCRIAGVGDPRDDLLPAHPAFLGVRRLRFGFEDGPAPGAGASSAVEWLEDLRDEGLVAMALDPGPPPLIRTRLDDGDQAWEVVRLDSGATLLGRREPAPSAPAADVQGLTDELRTALEAARATGAEPVLQRRLEIARAILDSADDGQEASDTAWPHFILPEAAQPPRRRLLAAAAIVLPETGPASPPGEPIAPDLEALALRGLAAAVNA